MSKAYKNLPIYRPQKGLVVTSNGDGTRICHWVDDPPPTKGGKACTPEQVAEMHARHKAYLEAYIAEREAKRNAHRVRKSG